MQYGYNGKILHIDLNDGSFEVEKPEEIFYRKYIGNGIMSAYYLLEKTEADIDALSPENLLMFMSGVANGHESPGLDRFVVSGKSPVTGGIGEARSEGPFAHAIKKTGYDGIIMQGACEEPSIVVIEDGVLTIEPAGDLWGKDTAETTDQLKEMYPDAYVATIGPAGENLVRFANVISEYSHQASKAGMGAVMGSKNVKAFVVKGGELPEVYDPEALKAEYASFDKRMRDNVLSMWQYDEPGFGVWIHTHGIDASLPVNNYQTSKIDYVDVYEPENFAPYFRGNAETPGCPNRLIKKYAVDEENKKSGGLHQELLGAMGPNLGLQNIETIIKANVLSNKLGMDPNSLGYTISFAVESAENDLLDPGSLNLSFNDDLDLLPLIEMIAKREGLGDILAEGSKRAAEEIGEDAEEYSMTVKGSEIPAFEPRTQTNLALGYAVGPTGPRYDICEHDWDYDTKVGWEHALDNTRTLGIIERIPMEYLGKEKVFNYKQLNHIWSGGDAFGISIFHAAPTRVYTLEDMARVISIVTGWETSSYEVMKTGEMRNQIFRLYNNREGVGKTEDTLPNRLFEVAIDSGDKKGVKLDKDLFHEMIVFYYRMMGWDEEGKLTEATLYEFGLQELI